MNFAATFDVKINFNDPALFAGFAADFEKLYSKYVSGAPSLRQNQQPAPSPLPTPAAPAAPLTASEPQTVVTVIPTDASAGVAEGDASGDTESVTAPDTPKRRRRTKAEMEAARAAEAAPAPDLPKPHGGANSGTTAPLELPTGSIQMPAGEITKETVFELLSKVMMLEPDPSAQVSTEVLAPHGLARMRDAQPEHFKTLCEGLVRVARSRGA